MATVERLHSPEQAAHWLRGQVRGQLRTDSRQVGLGDGLIAWPGAATDARRHVPAALAAGANACLVEDEGVDTFRFDDTRVRTYRGLKAASGPIAAHYYGQPSHQLPAGRDYWHQWQNIHRMVAGPGPQPTGPLRRGGHVGHRPAT